MNAVLDRKELVSGLIGLVSQGIHHDRLEDAEVVLACVRAMRPKLAEADTFEAWIAMKRGFWQDAIRILRNVDAAVSNWWLGRALMAFCQFAVGDPAWQASANDVMMNGQSPEAVELVMLLLDPEGSVSEKAQPDRAAAAPASASASDFSSNQYLRA